MKVLNASIAAMCVGVFSAGIHAQSGGQMKPMAPMAPMAMDVTYTGCVEAGKTPQTYMLSHAAKDAMMEPATLNLTGTSVDLSKHVGHKVSVTGMPVMATSKDKMDKMPSSFTVTSLKMISGSCKSTDAMPAAGDTAPDFTLARLDGKKIQLSALAKAGPVVVLMLRGWVGYQCPICNRQVGDFISHAKDLEAAGANVVLIYPGAADTVQAKAEDFVTGKTIPANMHFVVDPDLATVNAYHLRWDAPNETAYPSTFLVDTGSVIRFAKISRSHGDRSSAADVLAEIAKLKK